jgi:PEP-CTERM motif-containing protein
MEASVKRILQKAIPVIALVSLVAFAPARVEAGPILPGTAKQSVPVTTSSDFGSADPGTFLAKITSPWNITTLNNAHIVGSLTTAVYRNALGFVDFYYQIVNTTAPGNNNLSISGLAGSNFGNYTTSVGYTQTNAMFGGLFAAPTAGVRPKSADRGADGNKVTMWFGLPFTNKVLPQQTSAIMQIATNSRGWWWGYATVQNTGAATVPAFQVPEPASAVTALLGFALLGIRRRRA